MSRLFRAFPLNKTCVLIYVWHDSKGFHERKLRSRYCYFHYKALVEFSRSLYFTGWFKLLNYSSEKCSVCGTRKEIKED